MCQTKAEAIRAHCSCIEDTALDRFIEATVKLVGKCLWWMAKKVSDVTWVVVPACLSLALWVASSTIDGVLFVVETVILWMWHTVMAAAQRQSRVDKAPEVKQAIAPARIVPITVPIRIAQKGILVESWPTERHHILKSDDKKCS